MENYKIFLMNELEMSERDANMFLSGFVPVSYKKGSLILEEGKPCNTVRIILSGSARGFVNMDGKEMTINFYFAKDHAYDYSSYILNNYSEINIQALEALETLEMNMEFQDFMAIENLSYYKMNVNMFKMNFLKMEKERRAFILKSPKERYLHLLQNNKQIISTVPQHQVASYIGISPEHLSRIRRDIFKS